MQNRKAFTAAALVLGLGVGARTSVAQPAPPAAPRPAASQPANGFVDLNFPPNVELRVIVEYVSERLGINILFDEKLEGQKVTVSSPTRVSVESLPRLLESILRVKGFSLVDGGVPGWKRVAPVADVAAEGAVEFVPLEHADAAELAEQLGSLLGGRRGAEAAGGGAVQVSHDPRTNQLILVGPADRVADARDMIDELDVPVPQEQSPIHFYKLANATAADVLDTIRSLEGEGGSGGGAAPGGPSFANSLYPDYSAGSPRGSDPLTSPRSFDAPGGTPLPLGGAGGPSAAGTRSGFGAASGGRAGIGLTGDVGNGARSSSTPGGSFTGPQASPPREIGRNSGAPDPGRRQQGVGGAVRSAMGTVTADANTNTIIVVGGPAAQKFYDRLIRELDRRRPQVLIEATIVTLDTSNGFSLGVELAARRRGEENRTITFTSFGLSDVDETTGQLVLTPGLGFNGAILNADVADIVLRALKTSGRARIVSAPRILVNDNATGALNSVAEAPFVATNTGETIATTSFGGYAEAGTTIQLTPHISEADYLQLEYVVTLSNFTNGGSEGIPPSRQRNEVASQVTVPDGSAIVVGGLNQTQWRESISAVPLLGEIPILKYLFRSRTTNDSTTTLFVFIRPIILRDDEFRDLKFLSGRDAKAAGLGDGFPSSEPLVVN